MGLPRLSCNEVLGTPLLFLQLMTSSHRALSLSFSIKQANRSKVCKSGVRALRSIVLWLRHCF